MKIFLKILFLILLISCDNTGKNKIPVLNKTDSLGTKSVQIKSIEQNKQEIKTSEKPLDYIDIVNEIELSHTDDKYGEWGGDTDLILIYSNGNQYFANYSRYLGSVEPPLPPKENEKPKKWYEYKKLDFEIDSLKLNQSDKELIEKTILELLKNKLRNPTSFSHSGISNKIISKDSTLLIRDYPSIEWKSFQELKKVLKEK
ncbi:hypothetical protein [Salinimicrobium gaetbulicola]|uniref:Lipoprotein n=1 Tax=Salinimicrobium gaetbulicola TaxID=999702 RepID=A0ABW3ICG9_9FLAO